MKRNRAIDFYKFIFALVIFLLHFRNYTEFESSKGYFNGGYLAVEFFFIVSGYLLMSGMDRMEPCDSPENESIRFLLKRYRTLYPKYLCAIIIVFIARVILENGMTAIKLLVKSIPELLCLQIFWRPGTISSALWFVSATIWGGFLIYYLLLRNKDLMTKIVFPIAILLFIGWTYNSFETVDIDASDFVFSRFIRGFAEMGWGCTIYVMIKSWREKGAKLPVPKLIIYALEIGSLLLSLYIMYARRHDYMDFIAILLLSILIIITFSGEGILSKLLDNKISGYLGSLSYSIYLCQGIVIAIMFNVFSGMNYVAACGIGVVGVIIIAILFDRIIDRLFIV